MGERTLTWYTRTHSHTHSHTHIHAMPQVYHALARTEHEGKLFAEAVRSMMECETHWVAWKKEGCPPFERAPGG